MSLANESIFSNNSSENGDKTNCQFGKNEWHYSVLPVYIMIISVLGIIFNIFVLMVFCLHKKPCTTAEIYLSNLAAADLVLVSFLPFWAAFVSNHNNWTFGLFLCKTVNASILMNVYCSIYFIVLVSIDRYLALVHPLSHDRFRTPCFAKLGCALVWILGFLFSLPALIYRQLFLSGNSTFCPANYPSPAVKLTSDGLISVFGFIIPILIISFCTIKIIKALRGRILEGVNAKKTDHKANALILAVLLAFLICWVPFHLTKILFLFREAKILTECNSIKILMTSYQIFIYFGYFNSVLNPILYVIVGKNFQKKAKELFKQWDHTRTTTISNSSWSTRLTRNTKSQQTLN